MFLIALLYTVSKRSKHSKISQPTLALMAASIFLKKTTPRSTKTITPFHHTFDEMKRGHLRTVGYRIKPEPPEWETPVFYTGNFIVNVVPFPVALITATVA